MIWRRKEGSGGQMVCLETELLPAFKKLTKT
jgi:hypothetical protein